MAELFNHWSDESSFFFIVSIKTVNFSSCLILLKVPQLLDLFFRLVSWPYGALVRLSFPQLLFFDFCETIGCPPKKGPPKLIACKNIGAHEYWLPCHLGILWWICFSRKIVLFNKNENFDNYRSIIFWFTILIVTEIDISNNINLIVDLSCKFQRNIQFSLVMIPEHTLEIYIYRLRYSLDIYLLVSYLYGH